MNTYKTEFEVEVEPIDQARFAARYKRYNMSEYGMTQLQPEAVKAIAAVDLTPTIEEIEEQIREIMPAPQPTIEEVEKTYAEISDDLNQFTEAYAAMPKIEEQLIPQQWKPTLAWTKPDLVKACRCYGLSPSGNKTTLLGRLQTALA